MKFGHVLKTLGRLFVVGLITVLPFIVTFYVIYWIIAKIEGVAGKPFDKWLPVYIPGMGVVAAIIVLVGIGALVKLYAARRGLDVADRLMARIPFAKIIYSSTKDVVGLFSAEKKSFNKVVLLQFPNTPYKLLGLVTREGFEGIKGLDKDSVAVYLSMSYQIGGYTVIVPKEYVEETDMSVDDAIRFMMTAGVSSQKSETASDMGVLPLEGIPGGLPKPL